MQISDFYGNTVDTDRLGPDDAAFLMLAGCPVRHPQLMAEIMRRHVDGNGAGWRERQPIAQRVHVGPEVVWLVTHADPKTGARLTIAMSQDEFIERGGAVPEPERE